MTATIPAWLTAVERVKGEPRTRLPDWIPGKHYAIQLEEYLDDALRAFDAVSAELFKTQMEKTPTQDAYDAACKALHAQRARAEKAEARVAELERENERLRNYREVVGTLQRKLHAMEPLPPEFAEIVNKNFWDLLA